MKKITLIIFTTLIPVLAIAQSQTLGDELLLFVKIINAILPFLVGLGTLYVVWGTLEFIRGSGNEDARTEGRNRIIYGIIGLFVMVSIWGFVNILINTLGLENPTMPPLPILGVGDRDGVIEKIPNT